MSTVATADIRNVALAGHGGSGKTTLLERLLFDTKLLTRMGSVTDGSTVGDFEPEEKTHQHSLKPAFAHFTYEGHHINLVDTPGASDLFGHVVSVLPGVETVAITVDATKGIEVTTRRVFRLAAELALPRLIIVTKIDHAEADLEGLVERLRDAFGAEVLPINLPIDGGTDVIDVFDHDHAEAGHSPDFFSVEDAHKAIIEQVIEVDDELTNVYLEQGEKFDPAKLHAAFESALRQGHLVPLCFCSARTGVGIADLLHIIASMTPSPLEATPKAVVHRDAQGAEETVLVQPDPSKPAVAQVFKVLNDPFVGKLAVFRVLQGTVRTRTELLVGDSRKPVRIGHLFRLQGKEHREVDAIGAGDIGVVPKIDELRIGSVLHADAAAHDLRPMSLPFPKPLFGLAVELKNHADESKFSGAVHKLMEEDPCFRMERVAATGQTVVRGLGELHLRVILEKLRHRFNIDVVTHPPKVAYKETVTARAEGHHRHKKQTGGAGQFGEVYLRVEPLPPDHAEGFEFVNDTVGGSIPRQFMPAIEKGVRQVLETGAVAGYPLTGVRVSVYDGKHHPVDSKEVAFVAAGKRAFIDAVQKARPVLLEPFVTLEITAPSELLGGISAQLSTKRGRVQSTDMVGADTCLVRAQAPLGELQNFANEFKSITGGQGSYAMEYSHDEHTPSHIQQAVIAAYKPRADEE